MTSFEAERFPRVICLVAPFAVRFAEAARRDLYQHFQQFFQPARWHIDRGAQWTCYHVVKSAMRQDERGGNARFSATSECCGY